MTEEQALKAMEDLKDLALDGMEMADFRTGFRVAKEAVEKQKRIAEEAISFIRQRLLGGGENVKG